MTNFLTTATSIAASTPMTDVGQARPGWNQPPVFFWLTLLLTAAVKLTFAGLIPVIGDEAMYALWARQLDYGYFDHPPVVSWLLYPVFLFGESPILLRLPSVLVTSAIGVIIYYFLKGYDNDKAALTGSLFLASPAYLLAGIFYSPEAALIFFSVLAGVTFFKATKHENRRYYLLAGVFLGVAFLSKYFAALLGITFGIYTLFHPSRVRIKGLMLVVAGAAPFILLNLGWNYNHCWANIMHNFVNRVADADVSLKTPLFFLAGVVYLALPFTPALRRPKEKTAAVEESPGIQAKNPRSLRQNELGFFAWLFLVPFCIFVSALFFKSVRLHWLLSFYPFVFIFLSRMMSLGQLRACFKLTLAFSAVHILALAVLLGTYDRLLDKDDKIYRTAVSGIHHAELAQRLAPYRGRYQLFGTSYSYAAMLSFYLGADVGTFGSTSFRGRQDDLRKDFRTLNGQDILIISRKPPNLERYSPFFDHTQTTTIPVADAELFLILGHGFNYGAYREEVINRVIRDVYAIPAWLPMGRCYMFEKYR